MPFPKKLKTNKNVHLNGTLNSNVYSKYYLEIWNESNIGEKMSFFHETIKTWGNGVYCRAESKYDFY